MKTTLNTQVKGVTFELSLVEALAFLKDPSRVQHEVMSMLKGGKVDVSDYENNPGAEKESEPRPEPEGEVCPYCRVRFQSLAIHLGRGCKQDPDRK